MAGKNYLNGTKLDDRIIRADLDPGFEPGRQYGRGQTGGQVRDDRRREFDEGRGGLPPKYKRKLEQQAVASGTMDASAAIQTQTQAYHNHYGTNHRYNERDENRGRGGYGYGGGHRKHDRYHDGNKQKNEYHGSGFAQLDSIGNPGPKSKRDWNKDEGNQDKTNTESKQKSIHDSSFAPPPHKRPKLQDAV